MSVTLLILLISGCLFLLISSIPVKAVLSLAHISEYQFLLIHFFSNNVPSWLSPYIIAYSFLFTDEVFFRYLQLSFSITVNFFYFIQTHFGFQYCILHIPGNCFAYVFVLQTNCGFYCCFLHITGPMLAYFSFFQAKIGEETDTKGCLKVLEQYSAVCRHFYHSILYKTLHPMLNKLYSFHSDTSGGGGGNLLKPFHFRWYKWCFLYHSKFQG